jgi:hypothetical protein
VDRHTDCYLCAHVTPFPDTDRYAHAGHHLDPIGHAICHAITDGYSNKDPDPDLYPPPICDSY